MKLTLKHVSIPSTDAVDSLIEKQIFALQRLLRIDEANVSLTHHPEMSPAYTVDVHLVTPGPDVFAAGKDHTLQAAIAKVMDQLGDKISGRTTRRQSRLKGRAQSRGPASAAARSAA